jgi:hypothetical protein
VAKVVEFLSSKHEALSPSPSTAKRKKHNGTSYYKVPITEVLVNMITLFNPQPTRQTIIIPIIMYKKRDSKSEVK